MYTEALPFGSEANPLGVNIRLPPVRGHDPPKGCLHLDANSDFGGPQATCTSDQLVTNQGSSHDP